MIRSHAWCAALLALAATSPARVGAQRPVSASAPLDSRAAPSSADLLRALEPGAVSDSIRAIVAGAAARGVSAEPLVDKVREGLAKRSTPIRIRDAVQSLALRLTAAREALAPVVSIDETSAGAGAIQAGVAPPLLRDLRRVWPATSLAVPLGVVTELVAEGVKPAQAGARVRELMANGAKGAQLVALGASVRDDIAAGMAPTTAFEVRSKSVLSLLVNPTVNSLTSHLRPNSPPSRPPKP